MSGCSVCWCLFFAVVLWSCSRKRVHRIILVMTLHRFSKLIVNSGRNSSWMDLSFRKAMSCFAPLSTWVLLLSHPDTKDKRKAVFKVKNLNDTKCDGSNGGCLKASNTTQRSQLGVLYGCRASRRDSLWATSCDRHVLLKSGPPHYHIVVEMAEQ